MKKLRKNVKNYGQKAFASLMIASSMVGLTAPAFANDDVQPEQPIVNEEKPLENNDTNPESNPVEEKDENNDANPESNPVEENDENDVNKDAEPESNPAEQKNSEQDSADAKKQAEEQKKKKEEYEKKSLDEFGKTLGPEIAKLFTHKYDSASEAINTIGVATLKGLNEGFVKNIPYGGGFLYSLIKGLADDPAEKTDQQKIEAALQRINKSINTCTQALINQSNVNGQDSYISDINKAIKTLQTEYDHKNKDLKTDFECFKDNSEELSKTLSKIYSSDYKENAEDTNKYLAAFKTFAVSILGGQPVNGSSVNGGGKNVYQLSDSVGMAGRSHIMEFYQQRLELVDAMKEIFGDGNNALSLAMQTDQKKVNATIALCQYNKGLIKQEMENTTDEARLNELQKQYDEYNQIETNYTYRKNRVKADLDSLEALKNSFDAITAAQTAKIAKNKETFENNKPAENLYNAGTQYSAITVKKTTTLNDGSVKTEEVKAYPSYNADEDKIEYRDQFGYLCATKECSKKSIEFIKCSDVQEKQKYILYDKCNVDYTLTGNKGTVTIDKVYEGESFSNKIGNFFKSIFGSNENRFTSTMIDYTDSDGVKHTGVNISNASNMALARYKMRQDFNYQTGYKAA